MSRPVSYEDYREVARRRIPSVLYDYIVGGSYDEVTLGRNVEAFRRIALRQRVMVDVSCINTEIELFGRKLAMPLVLAPIGLGGMNHTRGELQAHRAAAKAGLPFILSTMSLCPLEEVGRHAPDPFWFQLYMAKDRGYCRSLIQRAKAAGCPVLFLTVDLPVPGARYRDIRSGLTGGLTPLGHFARALDGLSRPGWMRDVYLKGRPHVFGNLSDAMPDARDFGQFWTWVRENFDASVTWKDVEWIRGEWNGPIVIKGLTDPEDARDALAAGADGIVVSNHGGRQLDGAPGSIEMLPQVAEAVGDRMTVLVDGGVRSGLDVLRALSLGAKACLIGRAWVWPLAARGEAGVGDMLSTMRAELNTALALTGCTDVKDAGPHLLVN